MIFGALAFFAMLLPPPGIYCDLPLYTPERAARDIGAFNFEEAKAKWISSGDPRLIRLGFGQSIGRNEWHAVWRKAVIVTPCVMHND